jgi:hypothetical protein
MSKSGKGTIAGYRIAAGQSHNPIHHGSHSEPGVFDIGGNTIIGQGNTLETAALALTKEGYLVAVRHKGEPGILSDHLHFADPTLAPKEAARLRKQQSRGGHILSPLQKLGIDNSFSMPASKSTGITPMSQLLGGVTPTAPAAPINDVSRYKAKPLKLGQSKDVPQNLQLVNRNKPLDVNAPNMNPLKPAGAALSAVTNAAGSAAEWALPKLIAGVMVAGAAEDTPRLQREVAKQARQFAQSPHVKKFARNVGEIAPFFVGGVPGAVIRGLGGLTLMMPDESGTPAVVSFIKNETITRPTQTWAALKRGDYGTVLENIPALATTAFVGAHMAAKGLGALERPIETAATGGGPETRAAAFGSETIESQQAQPAPVAAETTPKPKAAPNASETAPVDTQIYRRQQELVPQIKTELAVDAEKSGRSWVSALKQRAEAEGLSLTKAKTKDAQIDSLASAIAYKRVTSEQPAPVAAEPSPGRSPAPTAPEAQAAGAVGKGEASPLKQKSAGIRDAFLGDLSKHTDKVYTETTGERALADLLEGNGQPGEVWLSNNPDTALGQGGNKGVVVEMDAKGLQGQLSRSKPGWDFAYDNGSAEFVGKHNDVADYSKNVRSVTVKAGAQMPNYASARLKGFLKDWEKTTNPDGSVTYTKPSPSPPAAGAAKMPSLTDLSVKQGDKFNIVGTDGKPLLEMTVDNADPYKRFHDAKITNVLTENPSPENIKIAEHYLDRAKGGTVQIVDADLPHTDLAAKYAPAEGQGAAGEPPKLELTGSRSVTQIERKLRLAGVEANTPEELEVKFVDHYQKNGLKEHQESLDEFFDRIRCGGGKP